MGPWIGEDGVIAKMIPVCLVLAWAIPAILALWFFGIIALGLLVALSLAAKRAVHRARPLRWMTIRIS